MLHVVVGERCKGVNPGRSFYFEPDRYWKFQRHKQVFKQTQQQKLLSLMSLTDDDEVWWMNLLLPHPTPGLWHRQDANRAASAFWAECPLECMVVACGSRVARALFRDEYPERLGEVKHVDIIDGWGTRLPHPRSRNKQWEDVHNMGMVKARMALGRRLI
jgi:hypothetical protein